MYSSVFGGSARLRFQIINKEHLAILQTHVLKCFVDDFICRTLSGIHSRLGIEYTLGKIRCYFKFIWGFRMAE